jgi:hypothetical protein
LKKNVTSGIRTGDVFEKRAADEREKAQVLADKGSHNGREFITSRKI